MAVDAIRISLAYHIDGADGERERNARAKDYDRK